MILKERLDVDVNKLKKINRNH